MSHAFYVYSAWGISVLLIVIVVIATWIESRRLQRDLKRLEAQGIRRRSTAPAAGGEAS